MKPWSCAWRGIFAPPARAFATRSSTWARESHETQVSTSGGFRRVGDALARERAEELLHEQHHVQVLAEDHAGRVLVGELRVERVAELREEIHGALQVPDGQVDEDLQVHGVLPSLSFRG